MIEQRVRRLPALLLAHEPAVVVQRVGVTGVNGEGAPEGVFGELVVSHGGIDEPAQVHGLPHVGFGLKRELELIQRRVELAAREIALRQFEPDAGAAVGVGLVGVGLDLSIRRRSRSGTGTAGKQKSSQCGQQSLHQILDGGMSSQVDLATVTGALTMRICARVRSCTSPAN